MFIVEAEEHDLKLSEEPYAMIFSEHRLNNLVAPRAVALVLMRVRNSGLPSLRTWQKQYTKKHISVWTTCTSGFDKERKGQDGISWQTLVRTAWLLRLVE